MIVPQAPNATALTRLRNLNRAVEKQRNGRELSEPVEEFAGTIESFDPQKGYGCIRREDGELVFLSIACLRAGGHKSAAPGSVVRFEAIERDKGWMAFRIHSLEQPTGQAP